MSSPDRALDATFLALAPAGCENNVTVSVEIGILQLTQTVTIGLERMISDQLAENVEELIDPIPGVEPVDDRHLVPWLESYFEEVCVQHNVFYEMLSLSEETYVVPIYDGFASKSNDYPIPPWATMTVEHWGHVVGDELHWCIKQAFVMAPVPRLMPDWIPSSPNWIPSSPIPEFDAVSQHISSVIWEEFFS